MKRKEDVRGPLLRLEPANKVAANPRSTIDDLERELRVARTRAAESRADVAVPAVVKYRQETDGKFSYKLFVGGKDEPMTDLLYGNLPDEGAVIAPAEWAQRQNPLLVDDSCEGLDIIAGDLRLREVFDPRRIYTSANGTRIAFKRTDGIKVILWSYKLQGEVSVGHTLALVPTEEHAKPTARGERHATQKDVAAYAIAQNPEISGQELTEILAAAFPEAKIGPRHGPHYLSLSRSGKLPEPSDTDPRKW